MNETTKALKAALESALIALTKEITSRIELEASETIETKEMPNGDPRTLIGENGEELFVSRKGNVYPTREDRNHADSVAAKTDAEQARIHAVAINFQQQDLDAAMVTIAKLLKRVDVLEAKLDSTTSSALLTRANAAHTAANAALTTLYAMGAKINKVGGQ